MYYLLIYLEMIMVEAKDSVVIVDQSVLFPDDENVFYGFRRVESVDFISRILDKHKLVPHEQALYSPGFKQILVCSLHPIVL